MELQKNGGMNEAGLYIWEMPDVQAQNVRGKSLAIEGNKGYERTFCFSPLTKTFLPKIFSPGFALGPAEGAFFSPPSGCD